MTEQLQFKWNESEKRFDITDENRLRVAYAFSITDAQLITVAPELLQIAYEAIQLAMASKQYDLAEKYRKIINRIEGNEK